MLDATVALLTEGGVENLTIEAVAARSGVAKTTIYRHWDDRYALITDAVRCTLPHVPNPDTGSLRDDLHTIFGHLARAELEGPAAGLLPALLDAVHRDPALAQLKRDVVTERERPVMEAIDRAVVRGELAADVDPTLVYDVVTGPIVYRKVLRRREVTPERAERLIDIALRGVGVAVPADVGGAGEGD